MNTWLLWIDCESTGLNTDVDEIIEIACILTHADSLDEVGRFHALLRPSPEGLMRLVSNPVVLRMHTRNGLLLELAELPSSEDADDVLDAEIEVWLRRYVDDREDTVHLAGSGVAAFDRPLIQRLLPAIDSYLHYAPIDVGVLKRTWKMWVGHEITGDNEAKNHRAMDDVAGHLNEARAFRERFKVVHETLQAKD